MTKQTIYYLYIFSCSRGKYVGLTTNPTRRKYEHKYHYKKLKFHIIKKFRNKKEAKIAEEETIKRIGTKNLLNKLIGNKLSNEMKESISKSNTYRQISNYTKEKIRKALLGHKDSNETRKRKSTVRLGHKHSKETIEKMSMVKLGNKNPFFGKKHSEKTKEKMKKAHIKD